MRWAETHVDADTPGKDGFFIETGNLITGSGWVAAGPGYRRRFADGRYYAEASGAVSWHAYKLLQSRFELPRLARGRLTIGGQVLWRDATQVAYFGPGPDTALADDSLYRLRTLDSVGYGTVSIGKGLSFYGAVGWLRRPDLLGAAGTFPPDSPNSQVVFPGEPAFQVPAQPDYLHGRASILLDTRDRAGYPSSGAVYRASYVQVSDR
jgi:hypothetical protein